MLRSLSINPSQVKKNIACKKSLSALSQNGSEPPFFSPPSVFIIIVSIRESIRSSYPSLSGCIYINGLYPSDSVFSSRLSTRILYPFISERKYPAFSSISPLGSVTIYDECACNILGIT